MKDRALVRAERLETIQQLLYCASEGLSAAELAARCGVHRATIYRDIQSLSESMGVPVWEGGGRFGIDRTRYLPPVRLNLHEALALYVAARLLAHHSDEQNPHVVTALEKLAVALPSPIQAHVVQAAVAVRQREIDNRYVAVVETLARAWAERRRVRIWYRSAGSETTSERELDPYFFEPSAIGYSCYCMGYDYLRGDLRTFKLERIERAELLPIRYEIPDDFDPYPYLSRSWGIMGGDDDEEVKLRFSSVVAYRVRESIWHPSQSIEDLPDGGCLFTVRIAHPLEMKWWIRSWGPEVEVLAPAGLREEMRGEAERMAKIYGISSLDWANTEVLNG